MAVSNQFGQALAKNIHWRYLVLDEGHKVKNDETQISAALRNFHRQNTLLLTGTPLQNNLRELYCLLNFLYGPPTSKGVFENEYEISMVCAM